MDDDNINSSNDNEQKLSIASNGVDSSGATGASDGENLSAVEVADINARSKNFRTLCGCFLGLVTILLLAAIYPIYKVFSTGEKAAGSVASGMGNAISVLKAYIDKAPDVEVVYGSQFVSSNIENKYIVSSLDERVDVRPEFSKYGLLSASLNLSVTAHYQYYIPLRGVKFDVRKSRDDGKFYFTFYFDSLKCDFPVKFTEIERDAKQSAFSDDLNKELKNYQKSAFPAYLISRGENSQNMATATEKARKSAERYIRDNYFPHVGISVDEIGGVDVVFNTYLFETFKVGVKKPTVESGEKKR